MSMIQYGVSKMRTRTAQLKQRKKTDVHPNTCMMLHLYASHPKHLLTSAESTQT